MRYSALTQRIAGEGAAAWQIHDRALELRAEGVDILLLSVGDPDFDTPLPIVHGAIDSLLAGDTHYSEVRGRLALRKLIAERHRRRSGQAVDADHVIVMPGAQCAVYSVAQCLLDPGDEVIVAEPMYVTYEGVLALAAQRWCRCRCARKTVFVSTRSMSLRASPRKPAPCCSTVRTIPAARACHY